MGKLFNLGKQDDVRQYVIKSLCQLRRARKLRSLQPRPPRSRDLSHQLCSRGSVTVLPLRGGNGRRTVSRPPRTPKSWLSARRRLRKPRGSDAKGQQPTGRAGLQSLQLKFTTPHFWLTYMLCRI